MKSGNGGREKTGLNADLAGTGYPVLGQEGDVQIVALLQRMGKTVMHLGPSCPLIWRSKVS